MSRKLLVWLLLLVLLVVSAGCGKRGQSKGDESEFEVSFTAKDLFSGETVDFPGDYLGDVVYLCFFSFG